MKPVQFWGRAWFRLHRPRPDPRAAPPLRTSQWPAQGPWPSCARAPSMTGPARFRFLSVERELVGPDDWDRAGWPRLWRYNLHYFDDLVAEGAAERAPWHRALLERWIAENPPGHGTGWEPYPTSLRIVNWVKWVLTDGQTARGGASRLSDAALHSLAIQARWLRTRLEMHLLGNHLWANAKALIFAGAFFDGDEAARWRNKGFVLLRGELREQFVPDGGHFERSPMYHATLLEDLLDLIQLGARYPQVFAESDLADWRETAQRMLRWLRVMTHPDGEIAFFNDAAIGIAPNPAALVDYAARLGLPSDDAPLADIEPLPQSGYVRLQAGPAVLIADVAPIGPDYLPGHAHADTLSFELSVNGERVLVNSGTSTYEVGDARLRQRGTAAHNTVVVNGQDSSEVWGSFRVARRARPLDVSWGLEPGAAGESIGNNRGGRSLWLNAAHDGYRRLPGRVIHRREWRLTASALQVVDRLENPFTTAQARWHVHPREAGDESVWFQFDGAQETHTEPATWHPRFGASEPTIVRVATLSTAQPVLTTRITWSALPESSD